jgi:hypothetical protein
MEKMTESAAPRLVEVEVTTLAGTTHANLLYPLDAPLIRVGISGRPDAVTAAIAGHITDVWQRLPRAAGRPADGRTPPGRRYLDPTAL